MSRAIGNTNDSKAGKDGPGRANKGGKAGEPEEVKGDASTRGPKARCEGDEGTSDNGRDATAGERGDTPAWDTIDDPRGKGADWPSRRVTAAGSEGTIEGQRSWPTKKGGTGQLGPPVLGESKDRSCTSARGAAGRGKARVARSGSTPGGGAWRKGRMLARRKGED